MVKVLLITPHIYITELADGALYARIVDEDGDEVKLDIMDVKHIIYQLQAWLKKAEKNEG